MADPWLEIVQPIWPEVVDIVRSIWTPQLCSLLDRAGVLQGCKEVRGQPHVVNVLTKPSSHQAESCLVATSLGGEASFNAFLQCLLKFSPIGELLSKELNKMWTSFQERRGEGESCTANPCWRYKLLSSHHAQHVITTQLVVRIAHYSAHFFAEELSMFSPSEHQSILSAGGTETARKFLDILLCKGELAIGLFVAGMRATFPAIIDTIEVEARMGVGQKLDHVKQKVLANQAFALLQNLAASSESQLHLGKLQEALQAEAATTWTRKSPNLQREKAAQSPISEKLILLPKPCLSPEAQQSYDKALQGGERKVPHIRALFCGLGRVGKTCLGRSMLGLDFLPQVDSTIGVELRKLVCTVRRRKESKIWIWRAEKDVDEQQRLLAKKVLKEEVRERQEAEAAAAGASEVTTPTSPEYSADITDEEDLSLSERHLTTPSTGENSPLMTPEPSDDAAQHAIATTAGCILTDVASQVSKSEAHQECHSTSPLAASVVSSNSSQSSYSRQASESEKKTKLQAEAAVHVKRFLEEIHHLPAEVDSSLDDDMCFVDLWDFAGQESFTAIQHMLLSELRCVYAVVFDASLGLDAPAQTTFCLHGEEQLIEGASVVTNFDVMEGWLNTIHQAVGDTDAPVYIIGCKVDQIPLEKREAKKKDIVDYIWQNTEDKAYRTNIDDILFVDNTVSGSSKEDPSIIFLRQDVINKMSEQLEMPIPLRWLPFTVAVRQLARMKDHPWLSMDQVSEVAREVCKADAPGTAEVDVKGLLQFHHHLGHVLYYTRNQHLNDRVIIDVEWLLKIVSLLFVPQTGSQQEKRYRRHYNLLRQKGILLEGLAQRIWSRHDDRTAKYTQLREQRDFLFHLMEEFSLLFNTGEMHVVRNFKPSRKFYIPALVTRAEDASQVATAPIQQSPPIYLFSGTKLLFPQTLFWCLVVRCMKQYQSNQDPVLYRNSARILCHKVFWLVLTYFQHGIKFVVEHEHSVAPLTASAGAAPDNTELEETCHTVLLFVEAQLEELKGDALKHVVLKRAAHCKCPLNKRPCRKHNTSFCLQTDCRHFVELVEGEVPRCPLELKLGQDVRTVANHWLFPPSIRGPSTISSAPVKESTSTATDNTQQAAVGSSMHPPGQLCEVLSGSGGTVSSQEVVSVCFKTLSSVSRARIFNAIAREFAAQRSRLVSLLLGSEGNEELNMKRPGITSSNVESDLLFEGLRMWFEQSENPTGRELYDTMIDAGCPEGLVKKYKIPFELPPSYVGGVSIF